MEDIAVIIPTLNEEESLGKTLDSLLNLYPEVSIIVSDGGSKDKTREIVKQYSRDNNRILLLDREREPLHGLTVSVLDAVRLVKTTYFAVMDGDLQHPPEKIREMYEKLRQGADVVVGTRQNTPKEWRLLRKIMSRTANIAGRARLLVSGCYTEDPVSGFFAGRTSLFQQVIRAKNKRFVKTGFKVLIDFLKTLPKTTKVENIYYSFQLRRTGKSKIGMRHVVVYLKSLIT